MRRNLEMKNLIKDPVSFSRNFSVLCLDILDTLEEYLRLCHSSKILYVNDEFDSNNRYRVISRKVVMKSTVSEEKTPMYKKPWKNTSLNFSLISNRKIFFQCSDTNFHNFRGDTNCFTFIFRPWDSLFEKTPFVICLSVFLRDLSFSISEDTITLNRKSISLIYMCRTSILFEEKSAAYLFTDAFQYQNSNVSILPEIHMAKTTLFRLSEERRIYENLHYHMVNSSPLRSNFKSDDIRHIYRDEDVSDTIKDILRKNSWDSSSVPTTTFVSFFPEFYNRSIIFEKIDFFTLETFSFLLSLSL